MDQPDFSIMANLYNATIFKYFVSKYPCIYFFYILETRKADHTGRAV
jgi:hypothetical protein